MATRNFQLTSQVGTRLTYVDPANFLHTLTVNQKTAQKAALGVSGVKVHNSKWSLREVLEVKLPTSSSACTPCPGDERISVFIEVSGSIDNKVAVLEALNRAVGNAQLVAVAGTSGLPFTAHNTLIAGNNA